MFQRSWLLKRNWIICPEIAVNIQFMPGKSKFFKITLKKLKLLKIWAEKIDFFKLPEKIEFFLNVLKGRNPLEICLEESEFLVKLPEKIEILGRIFLENRNFLWTCLKISKFFENLPWKCEHFCEIIC